MQWKTITKAVNYSIILRKGVTTDSLCIVNFTIRIDSFNSTNMRSIGKSKGNEKSKEANEVKLSSSYDTTRAETNTPQKVREGKEPEAIRQRLQKGK
jgi:spore germination protein YaaH